MIVGLFGWSADEPGAKFEVAAHAVAGEVGPT